MERRGEFPSRFNLTPRCVVRDLEEVENWLDSRRQASRANPRPRMSGPDGRRRKQRPVRT
ncbi:helix-turn-helix transcriptional regulator [Paraburkholderia oxyphila]